jgi:peptidoglycan hydrolase-like protein with peptidoglycan-binding domain
MSVPILRPGDKNDAVPRMKRALVRELMKLELQSVAEGVVVASTTYGPAAVNAVEKFQAKKHLQVDGVVGKDTWRALGIDEPVIEDVGRVIVAPGANLPGRPIQPVTLKYVERMAAFIHKPITITTGTNHKKFTDNGSISDHFTGHAADIGMAANGGTDDGPVGDRIMEAALVLAGFPAAEAHADAQRGGLFTTTHENMHIQCIWKTSNGGNHHNHVHVGVRPL